MSRKVGRRGFLKGAMAAGMVSGVGPEEHAFLMQLAQAPDTPGKPVKPEQALPTGKIKDLSISRVICGGNLIGGWAHARDLIYTDKLVKTYHSDERIMMTMQLAEKCGINALITNPQLCRIINKYWHETGGKMQFISDGGNSKESIEKSLEGGASAIYFHGGVADRTTNDGKFEDIAKNLALIRSYGKPAGIGAHRGAARQDLAHRLDRQLAQRHAEDSKGEDRPPAHRVDVG